MIAPMRDALEQQVERESTALFATGRVWDDGIIDPRDTRTALSLALSACHSAPIRGVGASDAEALAAESPHRQAATSEPGGCDGDEQRK